MIKFKSEVKSYMSELYKVDTKELSQWLEDAKAMARQAGDIIVSSFSKRDGGNIKVESKDNVDFVTETDKASEDCIVSLIRQKYPDHRIIGEEGGFQDGENAFTDEPTWVIDPLDGTTNYCHGYPEVAVCIGVVVNQISVVGVVYNPIYDVMYSAMQGGGAFKNDVPIQVKQTETIGQSLFSTNIGPSRNAHWVAEQVGRYFLLSTLNFHSLRMNGSCALAMCNAAEGSVDCFFEESVGGVWDVCAASVIVAEAGGVTLDFAGDVWEPSYGKQSPICANAALANQVAQLFNFHSREHAEANARQKMKSKTGSTPMGPQPHESVTLLYTGLWTFTAAFAGVLAAGVILRQSMNR